MAGLFAASASVLPVLSPVGVSDDPIYARSVHQLVEHHRVQVLPITVATLLFQVGWGALFAWIFGFSSGVLRLATLVFTLLGGVGVYGVCRELGLTNRRSGWAVACFLFNPLTLVLAYSFMTDAYLASLIAIATACYLRGVNRGDRKWLVAGSVACACAFLVRHQGALIALAALAALLVARRLRINRRALVVVLQVAALPLIAIVGYYVWYWATGGGGGADSSQAWFYDQARQAGVGGTLRLSSRLLPVELAYLGLFVLPFACGLGVTICRRVRRAPIRPTVAVSVLAVVLAVIVVRAQPKRMPSAPQFLSSAGLGPLGDLRGGRAPIVGSSVLNLLSALVVAVVLLLIYAVALRWRETPSRLPVGLLLTVLALQAIGVLAPSYALPGTGTTLDRYLLPLLPAAVSLAAWAVDARLPRPVTVAGGAATAAVAVLAVAGTQDFLAYQGAAWHMAEDARTLGVPNIALDGGAAWDAAHLYDPSAKDAAVALPRGLLDPLSPYDTNSWWLFVYAPNDQATYIVSSAPLHSYAIVRQRRFSTWLPGSNQEMYLLRRAPAG